MDKTQRDFEAEYNRLEEEKADIKRSMDMKFDELAKMEQNYNALKEENETLKYKLAEMKGQIEVFRYCINIKR